MRCVVLLLVLSVLTLTPGLIAPTLRVRGQGCYFEDLLNRADLATVDELLAPDFVLHLAAGGDPRRGRAPDRLP